MRPGVLRRDRRCGDAGRSGAALVAEDLEDIVADYADDAILIVKGTTYLGRQGAREVFSQLLRDLPQARWELETVFADDVLYLEWEARSATGRVNDGTDTFVFADGKIRVQTVRYTVSLPPGHD